MRWGIENLVVQKNLKIILEARGSMIYNKIKNKNHIQGGESQGKLPEEIGWNSEKKNFGLKTRKIKVNREEYYNRKISKRSKK